MNAARLFTALMITMGVARSQEPGLMAPAPAMETRAVDVLAASPNAGSYPRGSYGTPGCGPHGCSGPVGGNGPITYEIYTINGVSMPVGGSELSGALKTGWTTGGGARTLLFNPERDAAWVIDIGVTYTGNRGQGDKTLDVATPRTAPLQVDPFTGQQTGGQRIFPDGIAAYSIRNLNRTNFNFAFGRDVWFWGPADKASEQGLNLRMGYDIGGRWGTSSIDLVPRLDPTNFLSRTGVTHSVFIGTHIGGERPMGHWILTYGLRAEWGYTWTNLIPPQGGDIHDVNITFTIGARF